MPVQARQRGDEGTPEGTYEGTSDPHHTAVHGNVSPRGRTRRGEHRPRPVTRPLVPPAAYQAGTGTSRPAVRSDESTAIIRTTTRRKSAFPSGHFEIHALGECSVTWVTACGARQQIPSRAWRHGRARALFQLLLSRPNLRITRDAAIETLWPDATLAAGSAYLSNALWNLRAALVSPFSRSPVGRETSPIHATKSLIALRATAEFPSDANCWFDVLAFEATCAEMRRGGQPEFTRRAAEAALALYSGPFLPETVGESWTETRREHLRLSWIESAFHVAEISLATGQWHAALEPLLRVLEDTPDHVDAACAAMRVLARMGRPQDALSLHDRVRRACWRSDEGYPEPLRRAVAAVRRGHLATSEMSGGRWRRPEKTRGTHLHAAH